ncbi:LiaF transmembrane domain-containing protein [Rhodanobacter hydrolyticus]
MTDNEANTGTNPVAWHSGRIIPALMVVGVGLIFLGANLGVQIPFLNWANWWAWFILLGAAWPLSEAWQRYRTTGTFDGTVAHSLLSALSIGMVATIFILDLSWGKWWPLFVIYGGLCMLVREPRRRRRDEVR